MARRELWQQISGDLYEVLGVSREATESEIQNAWRAKAKLTHPDRGGAAGEFQAAEIAFEVLSDQVQKRRYDLATRRPAPDPEWDRKNGFDFSRAARHGSDGPVYHPFPDRSERRESRGFWAARWPVAFGVLLCVVAVIISFFMPAFTVIVGVLVMSLVGIRYAGYARSGDSR